jgi:hypothetical protein
LLALSLVFANIVHAQYDYLAVDFHNNDETNVFAWQMSLFPKKKLILSEDHGFPANFRIIKNKEVLIESKWMTFYYFSESSDYWTYKGIDFLKRRKGKFVIFGKEYNAMLIQAVHKNKKVQSFLYSESDGLLSFTLLRPDAKYEYVYYSVEPKGYGNIK